MFEVRTNHPVAIDSPDHLMPKGTLHDNSINASFNRKLYELIGHPFRLMDLGCAGGGFVRDCVRDGHDAVGIEGSDRSRDMRRAEWATIPDRLMIADLCHPFTVFKDGRIFTCHVVTAWEVLEHIPQDKLDALFKNIRCHMVPGGYFIASVAMFDDPPWHVTLKPRAWWIDRLEREGFAQDEAMVDRFGQDWVRGGGGRFHVVARFGAQKTS